MSCAKNKPTRDKADMLEVGMPRRVRALLLFVLSVVSLQASGAAITVQYYSSAYVSATTSFPVAQTGGAGDFDGDGSSDDYRTVIPFDDARQLPPDATAYAGPAFFGAARGIRIGSTTAQAIDAKILMTSQYDGINISYGQSAGNNLWLDGIVYLALPGLAWDVSLSGIEVESAEVEEYVSFEAFPVAVAA